MSALETSVKFEATITVVCPGCRTLHYKGPALKANFEEVVAIGDTFTCKHCAASVKVTGESL